LVDEIENDTDMKSQMQGFLDRWEIVALVNGWTEDGDSYEG